MEGRRNSEVIWLLWSLKPDFKTASRGKRLNHADDARVVWHPAPNYANIKKNFGELLPLSRSCFHTVCKNFAPTVKVGFTCQSESGISFCGLQSSTARVILPFLA
jgi:hypothetical protein